MPKLKEALSRGWDTTGFLLGVLLALALPLYLATYAMHRVGVPSPAQLAGAGQS